MSAVTTPVPAAGQSPVRRLLPWLATERSRLALAILLGFLAIGSGVGLLATSAWLISSAALQPPILTLEVAIVGVRAFGIGKGVFRYAERMVSHDAAFRVLSRLRLAVYDRLAVVAPAGVPAYRRGDLLERLVRDVDATQDLPLRVLLPYASGALVALASVVLAYFILPASAVVLLVSLALASTVVPWIAASAAADAERASAPARGALNADVLTLLDGAADLTVSGAAPAWLDRLAEDDRRIGRLAARSANASGLASALGVLLSGGAVVAMLLVAIPAVRSGELVGVNLAVLVLLPLATYEAVVAMPTAALALGRVRGSAQRVVEVLDAVDPVPDPESPAEVPTGVVGVRLDGLRASWPSGPEVLEGLTLDVAPGERVAIVGSSGSGKSTLLAVLAGFLPYDGSVRLGDVELRDLRGSDVRTVVGWCPQLPHVFDTSVVENVRLAKPEASDDEVRAALDAVGLGPWLDAQPRGLNTSVGDHGALVSAGQRQRLGVARVLLAGHPVVLLDEPTEHLDEATAEVVAAELLRALTGRTVLWVAHRPHGVAALDRTVRLP
ncbi:thiol reductant ABC exporter subunit CydC [Longivirga aurantiaca]|uniref:Thiol reductant ABC exporter subunit CydC n=1 Tax=Longivirga aurantiaca TaxID=1837743 RepID=A0ABW1T5M0_9ACTN